ncbi:hypothetical protein [Aureliella helgolandensis]|uniref:Uncharacterized protein n=1 Tax=Aureliella helgolandensis TaxID=2527968 RepID=A0A518G4N8_9BACT|nr:hypothetical protein [Aureliella helgolandensis]QDV23558.1 hypothetical protein Q31a_18600 [Aureliella helgolandensis]
MHSEQLATATPSDAEQCRRLWARIESEGHFRVIGIQQHTEYYRWVVQIAVPWCRFARAVASPEQYVEFVQKLQDHLATSVAATKIVVNPVDTVAVAAAAPLDASPSCDLETRQLSLFD